MARLYSSLNEKDRRRYAAIESIKLGWGGMSYISGLFGCDYYTLCLGEEELADETAMGMSGIRAPGGGRKSVIEQMVGLDAAFLAVLSSHTAGSPMDERVKWTNLTRAAIAELLAGAGYKVSVTVVAQLLARHNYRKRKAQKRLSTGSNPARNQQFEKIAALVEQYQSTAQPVMSMDTKKKN